MSKKKRQRNHLALSSSKYLKRTVYRKYDHFFLFFLDFESLIGGSRLEKVIEYGSFVDFNLWLVFN